MIKELDLRHAFSKMLCVSNNVHFARIFDLSVTSAFQPILHKNGTLLGYEALIRPFQNGELASTDVFLNQMRSSANIAFVDRLIRALHLRNFSLLNEQSQYLFLNYEYESITDLHDIEAYKNLLINRKKELGIDDTKVVIEVLEHDVSSERNLKIMSNWHRQHHGILVAMDDMTDRREDWLRLTSIQPEIVKIDISMLQSPNYQRFVHRLKQFNLQILQEGIETAEQKEMAINAGVDLLQGYYIGYPTLIEQIKNKKRPKDNQARCFNSPKNEQLSSIQVDHQSSS